MLAYGRQTSHGHQAKAHEPFQGRIREGLEEGEEAHPRPSGRGRHGQVHRQKAVRGIGAAGRQGPPGTPAQTRFQCFASMFVDRQCFSAVWADGFPG
ncbi:hypothetical protein GBK79_03935 [Bifidobacterium longum]|nr:hypothetical protein GBK79_03935 [Bifidobacterium longum]